MVRSLLPWGQEMEQTGEYPLVPLDLEDYDFLEIVGRGSMGSVYRAQHKVYGYEVAIKRLHHYLAEDEELVARFMAEARAATSIAHPGIVNVLDAGRDEDTVYLVMEYVRGETLEARLKRDRLTLRAAVDIARQIAEVLTAAHGVGIVHRDLKPDNVFLTRHPVAFNCERVRILDFGIAKFADEQRTRFGAVLGTPYYMAPEQFGQAQTASRAADIYALGCVLYHMLAGRLPFDADIEAILLGHRPREAPPPSACNPAVPPVLDTLVMQMLAERPDRRPREMRIVSAALRAVLARESARDAEAEEVGETPELTALR